MSAPFQKILLHAARHLASGRLREAASVYRQVLHRDPHHPGALHGLGVLAQRSGRLDAAEKLLLRALAADPNLACAHDDLGSIRLLKGNVGSALEQYRLAIGADAAFAPAHVHLADVLTRLGQLEQAVVAYQRATTLSLAGWRRRVPGIDLSADKVPAAGPNYVAADPEPPRLHADGASAVSQAVPLESPAALTDVVQVDGNGAATFAFERSESASPQLQPVAVAAGWANASGPVAAAPILAAASSGVTTPVAAAEGAAGSAPRWPATATVDALPVPAPQQPPMPVNEPDAVLPTSLATVGAPAVSAADEDAGEYPVWTAPIFEHAPTSSTPQEGLLALDWEAVLAADEPAPTLPMVEAEIGDPRLDAPWAAARRRIAAVRTAPPAPTARKPAPVQPGIVIRPISPPVSPTRPLVISLPAAPAPDSPVAAPAEEVVQSTVSEVEEDSSAATTVSAPNEADDEASGISTVPLTSTLSLSDDPLVATRMLAKQLRRARRAPRDVAQQASELYKQSTEHLKERRVDQAIATLEQLVELHPGSAKAHRDLGAAYLRVDRLDDAQACLIKALELRPRFGDAYASLADVYHLQGKVEEAIACYRRALSLKPGAAKIHSNLLLTLNYHRKTDNKTLIAEHRAWALQHAVPLEETLRPHDNAINPDRQLRVGYMSPDFRRHSVNFFFEPILARHDRTNFHLTCYSDVARPDTETERIAGMCDQWRDIREMSDEAVAALVREDKIDILVDLAGHTGCNRMCVFARKPAPVQVTYLGYPNTTGMRVMDFRITDAAADPPGQTEQFHSEALVRLPNFLCYAPPAEAPEPAPPPILKNGYVTLGCFNILAKVTPDAIGLWAKIMTVLPNSRLVMKDRIGSFASPARRRYVLDILAYHRITPDRVDLLDKESDFESHLRSYEKVDIMLDPFPYNGTTTTCESLWMGVPVIALAGSRHAARVGVSVLTAAGMPEFIGPSLEAYARTAVLLARDPARLTVLRQTLRNKLRSSALLDAKRITASLENRYRLMWQRWCKLRQAVVQPAESMSLSDQ